MKLSEMRALRNAMSLPLSVTDSANLMEHVKILDLNTTSFHQELEMDSSYVDTYRDITYSNANIQLHSHVFYEILCCQNTCGVEYLVGSERYKLQKGDIIFLPPGVSHRPILPEHMTEPYIRDVLWINPEFMGSISHISRDWESYGVTTLLRTAGTKWEYLCDLFRLGVEETQLAEANWELVVFGNCITILAQLQRAYRDASDRRLQAETPELLDQVMAYIEAHLSEKITLAETARHFFICESTITQTFRKKMGVSFYRCVTQRRLIAAKELILDGLPMDAVSEHVGFADYSSFFRAFKQEYGISPSQFKKNQAHLP